MNTILKHIISFVLPVTVIIIIPLLIESDISLKYLPATIIGLLIICLGIIIMMFTISSFIIKGKGTLAPWSPPRKLVTEGIYKYVRNPMILGVLLVLTGESVAIWSLNLIIWDLSFFIINNLWFVLYEEPGLYKRFGKEYDDYKKNVSRWLPRLTPYQPD